MVFSGIVFLYYFLPVVVALYFLAPGRGKNAVLLLGSLVFYAWGEPRYVLVMGCTILQGYALGLLVERYRETAAGRIWCAVSVAGSLSFLIYFKYVDFFITNVNAATGLSVPLLRVSLPIGISFYTFQMISYTVDVYRGERAQRNILRLALYIAMFPQLIAGPIVRYADLAGQLEVQSRPGRAEGTCAGNADSAERPKVRKRLGRAGGTCAGNAESGGHDGRVHTWEMAAAGIRRFVLGLAKKVLLADQLWELCAAFRESGEKSVLFYWLYAVALTLQIYFDFSGYSDMAIGLCSVFGFRIPENFHYPFISGSVTEFWRRWHMSLGTWFRDYVYIPLGGSRAGKRRQMLNILIVWGLTGFWHGAEWNFIVWGLLFAVLLMIEKLWLLRWFRSEQGQNPGNQGGGWSWKQMISHGYLLFVVLISFVIFGADSMGQAVSDLGGMFGAGGVPFVSAEAVYCLRSFGVLLLAAVIGATPLPRRIAERLRGIMLVEHIGLLLLFLAVTAYLASGSFQPFLYFRF